MLEGFGIDLPSGGLVLLPRTIIVSLIVGLIVTVIAALLHGLFLVRVGGGFMHGRLLLPTLFGLLLPVSALTWSGRT